MPHEECHDDVCITCSDHAVPCRVVELLDGDLARVDTGVSIEVVSVALVDAAPGDTVLVHAKEAIGVTGRPVPAGPVGPPDAVGRASILDGNARTEV